MKGKRILVAGVKLAVTVIVIVGLGFAVRNGVAQWREETARLRAEIASIDEAIADRESDGTGAEISSEIGGETSERTVAGDAPRESLLERRRRLIASLPTRQNVRWGRVALAALAYGLGLVPPAMLLRQALRSFGQSVSLGVAIAAQLLGHAGKYAPGKAMVVVLRVSAVSRHGVEKIPATVSVFLETLLMMAVGATVAGVVVAWLPVPRWLVAGAVLGAIAAGVPTLPPILRVVTEKVTGWGKLFRGGDEQESPPRTRAWALFLAGWGWSLLAWLLIGGSFALLLTAVPTSRELPPPWTLYAVALASIALAVVAGFASLLPGGVGARELVLTTILAPAVGTGHALFVAIAARLLFLIVEASCAAIAWLWLRRQLGK